MKSYHKIQTLFKRDPETNHKTLLIGQYALPEFEYLKDNEWEFTEKVDGMNIRVMFDKGVRSFGGRSDNTQMTPQLITALEEMFPVEKVIEVFGDQAQVCFYGEGYGAGIQKVGSLYSKDKSFVLFDINIDGWWLSREDVSEYSLLLGIPRVPVFCYGDLELMVDKVSEGFASRWGAFTAEGLIGRPTTELHTRHGDRIITKLKYKDFLHGTV